MVEAIIAVAVGTIALGGMIVVWLSVGKMSQAGDVSAGLQEAGLAIATIHEDLSQALPDSTGQVLREGAGGGAWKVRRSSLANDGGVSVEEITYAREPAGDKAFRLVRTEAGHARALRGTYTAASFRELDAAGGPFVRVSLTVEGTLVTTLVRVARPELSTSKLLDWGFVK